ARGEEQCVTAVELAEGALCFDADGMSVPLVVEVARLAVTVRPDRRAVERHPATLSSVCVSAFRQEHRDRAQKERTDHEQEPVHSEPVEVRVKDADALCRVQHEVQETCKAVDTTL